VVAHVFICLHQHDGIDAKNLKYRLILFSNNHNSV